MDNQLPGEIQVIEVPGGVRYRLPPRQLAGTGCMAGVPLMLFGVWFTGFALVWIGAAIFMAPNFIGILFALFGVPFVLVGLVPLWLGLAALRGRSEIEFCSGLLRNIEYAGPLWWSWQRDVESISRLQMIKAGSHHSVNGKPIESLKDRLAIQVDCRSGRPMIVAFGYRRELLEPLANELARRCNTSEHARYKAFDPVEVIEKPPESETEPAELEQVWEQPASSLVAVEEHASGVTLNVPAPGLWAGSKGLFAFSILWCGFMFILTSLFVIAGLNNGDLFNAFKNQDAPPWIGLGCFGLFWAVGIGMMLGAINMGRRRAVLAVVDGQLMVMQTGIFGPKSWEWQRDEIEEIKAGPSGMTVNDQPVLELQIHPRGSRKVGLLSGRDHHELGWLAARLSQALGLRTLRTVRPKVAPE
ncbi:MAG: hypothetical protein AB7K24_02360 [Gemmataceae bacterium]